MLAASASLRCAGTRCSRSAASVERAAQAAARHAEHAVARCEIVDARADAFRRTPQNSSPSAAPASVGSAPFGSRPVAAITSRKFRLAASTRMRASPGAGTGGSAHSSQESASMPRAPSLRSTKPRPAGRRCAGRARIAMSPPRLCVRRGSRTLPLRMSISASALRAAIALAAMAGCGKRRPIEIDKMEAYLRAFHRQRAARRR